MKTSLWRISKSYIMYLLKISAFVATIAAKSNNHCNINGKIDFQPIRKLPWLFQRNNCRYNFQQIYNITFNKSKRFPNFNWISYQLILIPQVIEIITSINFVLETAKNYLEKSQHMIPNTTKQRLNPKSRSNLYGIPYSNHCTNQILWILILTFHTSRKILS